MKLKQILTIVIVSLLSAFAAVGIYRVIGGKSVTQIISPVSQQGFETAVYNEDKTSSTPFDFTAAARKGLPAVVHIQSSVERKVQRSQPRSMQDFFDFFGDPYNNQPQSEKGVGFGSGVIISPDGYIITNNHVISDANEIKVSFYDNKIVEAELIGTDPTTDIALLKVNRKDLAYLKFADSDQLEIGEWVAAIGNPAVGRDAFTLKSTVTAGIVSATGRNIRINEEKYAIESFIQTDAVINKGNSGGALVNVNGDLIGINTAISTPTGVYAGYGFAVPANLVKKVITDIKEFGHVKRALLGVTYVDIELITSRGGEVDTKEKEGLYIESVTPGSSAENAGLLKGDVLIEVDGKHVTDEHLNHLQEIIGRKRPGDVIKIVYMRNGKKKTTNVTLLSATQTDENYKTVRNVTNIDDLGIQIEELTVSEKETLNIENGVVVSDADANGILYRYSYGDISPGFIITKVNRKTVSSVIDFKNALKQSDSSIRIEGFHQNTPSENYIYEFPLR